MSASEVAMGNISVTKSRGVNLRAKFALVTLFAWLVSVYMYESAHAFNVSIMHNSSTTSNKYGSWGLDNDCTWCHINLVSRENTDNIKLVKNVINTPTGSRGVIFDRMSSSDNSAAGVFGNDARTYNLSDSTNICEVCHHQTTYHQYSSEKVATKTHENNRACTECHLHSVGFKPNNHAVPYYAAAGAGHQGCLTGIGCHTNANPANPYPAAAGVAPDCRACHIKDNPRTANVGCGSCHGAPGGTGQPIGVTSPDRAGSHVTHITTVGATCIDCHTTGGSGATVDHGKGNRNTNPAIVNLDATFNWNNLNSTCASASCHLNPYGAGAVTTPAWGTNANCLACHNGSPGLFQGNGAPNTGSHNSHMSVVGVACDKCHAGAVKDLSGGDNHKNAAIDVTNSYTMTGRGKHMPGTPGNATDYGTCLSANCHASPYDTVNLESPVWGAATGCASCHNNEGAFTGDGSPATGSHGKHMAVSGVGCGVCHPGAQSGVSGGLQHPNGLINVTNGYLPFSSVTKHSFGSPFNGFCSNASCHNDGNGTIENTPVWGASSGDCTACHKGDSASASKMATMKHGAHMNNYTTLGRGNDLKCAECHANTVSLSSNRLITNALNHNNGLKDYSGVKAGGRNNYSTATKVCSNVYCHSSGQAVLLYKNMTGSKAWDGAATLDCSGCHGSQPNASWSTTIGAPNYRNNSTSNNNSHQKHVASMNDTKGCAKCHNTTVDAQIANRLKDNSPAHLNMVRDVSFAVYGNYSSRTMTCSVTYCHSNVQAPYPQVAGATEFGKPRWGKDNGSMTCSSCHRDMSTLPEDAASLSLGSHRRHAVSFNINSTGHGGAGYSCNTCHGSGYSPTTTNDALHANGYINILFTGKAAGTTYSQYSSNVPGNGYGTCSTSRCHGRAVRSWGLNTTNPTCEKCHGSARTAQESGTFYDTTISSQSFAGKHVKHLAATYTDPVTCDTCHVVPSSINSFGHMSSLPAPVTFSGRAKYASLENTSTMSPTYNPSGQTCSNTYCHSGVKSYAIGGAPAPNWTSDSYGCSGCHGDPPAEPHPQVSKNNCKACHDHVNSTGDGFVNKSKHINGVADTTADDCLTCHATCTPEQELAGTCISKKLEGAHSVHTDVNYFLAGKKLSTGDYIDPGWIYSIKYVKGFPKFACGFCHPMESTSHKNALIDTDFDPAHSQLGTVKTKSKPAGTPDAGWYNTWIKTYDIQTPRHMSTVICGNVYCHSNGYISPTTNTYTYRETPDWYYSDKNGGASPWAGVDRCSRCHGNSPNSDSVNVPGSEAHARHVVANHAKDVFAGYSGKLPVAAASGARVHGNAESATTFNCNICHFNTVKVSWNDNNTQCSSCHSAGAGKGVMDIYTGGSTHVNGNVDVSFMEPFDVKSKAQLRNNIRSVQSIYTSWTRISGYKSYTSSHDHSRQKPAYVSGTCSTVTCHNGTPMEWRTKGPLSCSACHTALPN